MQYELPFSLAFLLLAFAFLLICPFLVLRLAFSPLSGFDGRAL
jgi:hypothetical protein